LITGSCLHRPLPDEIFRDSLEEVSNVLKTLEIIVHIHGVYPLFVLSKSMRVVASEHVDICFRDSLDVRPPRNMKVFVIAQDLRDIMI
jgi:hypothetical protein